MTNTIRYPFSTDSKLGPSENFEILQIVPAINYPFNTPPDESLTTNTLVKGGGNVFDPIYGDIRPLRTLKRNGQPFIRVLNQNFVNRIQYQESPFQQVVLEFVSDTVQTIGNGTTDLIGLFGEIAAVDVGDLTPNVTPRRSLIGILGVSLGPGLLPQIPMVQQAAAGGVLVGYSCISCNVAVFSGLSVGGVSADIACTNLRVIARPIHNGQFLG